MFKLTILLLSLLNIVGLTTYMLHKITRTPQLTVKKLEKPKRELALSYNSFVDIYPSKKINDLTKNLQWLLENDYQRDLRVKRILHQDLENLMQMATLKSKMSESDYEVNNLFDAKVDEVSARIKQIRHAKDAAIKEEIITHASLIELNSER